MIDFPKKEPRIKKSVDLPASLWRWVEETAQNEGITQQVVIETVVAFHKRLREEEAEKA